MARYIAVWYALELLPAVEVLALTNGIYAASVRPRPPHSSMFPARLRPEYDSSRGLVSGYFPSAIL